MTRLSLKNPIAILMIAVGLIVFAAVVTPRMAIDTFPELAPPVLVVGTLAPGLGPKDVEKTLTWRIEKYVSATPGVDHVESVSRNNLSIVYVWLKWGTDLNSAQTLVQQQTAFAMSAVPKSLGVLPPFVLQYDPSNAPVVQVAVWGGGLSGPQLYDYALNSIEPVLEGISGVASASLNGGRQRQINIVVDPVAAQSRGITSSDVAAAVSQSNALLPSGVFLSPKFDSNVYTNAVPERVDTIGQAIVKMHDGRPVLIRDVARVEDGGSPETQTVSVNGENAVYLNVLRVPGGNTLDIVDAVKKVVDNLKDLPPGLQVKPIFDQSTFVRTTYHGLRTEIVRALVLIALVILVFLQNPRAALIAGLAIPISFGIILIVLYVSGQTLNAFTLGGLTLAMGPLVDISVVVLESVHRHRLMGNQRGRGTRVGRYDDDDRGARARSLAERSGQEALRSPRPHRRGGHVRWVRGQHDHDPGRVPLLPRAQPTRQGGPTVRGGHCPCGRRLRRGTAQRYPVPLGGDPGRARARARERDRCWSPTEHVFSRDRRVDGAHLRAARTRRVPRRRIEEDRGHGRHARA